MTLSNGFAPARPAQSSQVSKRSTSRTSRIRLNRDLVARLAQASVKSPPTSGSRKPPHEDARLTGLASRSRRINKETAMSAPKDMRGMSDADGITKRTSSDEHGGEEEECLHSIKKDELSISVASRPAKSNNLTCNSNQHHQSSEAVTSGHKKTVQVEVDLIRDGRQEFGNQRPIRSGMREPGRRQRARRDAEKLEQKCDIKNNDNDNYPSNPFTARPSSLARPLSSSTNLLLLLLMLKLRQSDNVRRSSPKPRQLLLLLPSLLLALVLLLFASASPPLLASGLSLQPQSSQERQQEQEQQATPEADLNAAILATMSGGSGSQPMQQQQQQQQQQPFNSSESSISSPFKINSNDNHQQLDRTTISKYNSDTNNDQAAAATTGLTIWDIGRIFLMGAIIIGDICGNSLVILSVCRHSKLWVSTNWFVVSLACADILVALFAMTFNASVIISGKWLFSPWVCDFWNACDVLASTASILHLCCISIDRYVAITRPLDYPMKITTRRVVYCLCVVWISSALLSYLPIFTGIYTTTENLEFLKLHPDQCQFTVNRVYAIVSSSISFWIPCCIMVFTYYRIYKEASRQEKLIHQAQSIMPAPMPNHHSHNNHQQANHLGSGASAGSQGAESEAAARAVQRRSKSMALAPSHNQVGGAGSQNARIRQLAVAQQLQQFESAPSQSGDGCQLGKEQGLTATTRLTGNSTTSFQEGAPAEKQPLASGAGAAGPEGKHETLTGNNETSSTNPGDNRQQDQQLVTSAKTPNNARYFHEKDAFALKSGNNFNADSNNNNGNFHYKQRKQLHHHDDCDDYDDFDPRDPYSGQSSPTKRSISNMKRQHKAAKTLGIIMGVFIICWLPFFSWYTPMHICGHACDGLVSEQFVSVLFWIGYFNSTLNPIIYVKFNSEFRDAFKKTLQWLFCCCQDLKCLRVNRGQDNQHYNCTYRSTQEIVLVSNG